MFQELGIAHAVTFTGGIPEKEKNALLSQSRIGISPSYEEGWGLSINEFLGASLPVVGYDLPVFEQVFPGQLDLVALSDWQALANRITHLLSDQERQRQMGAQGRRFVERYDFRNVAREEFAAIQNLFPPTSKPNPAP
jgi:glycosyltransferase involved in cell wall biosynthesis